MWQQGKNKYGTDKYYIQNGSSTICKIGIKPTYELWHNGIQYCGFADAAAAKAKFNELEAIINKK